MPCIEPLLTTGKLTSIASPPSIPQAKATLDYLSEKYMAQKPDGMFVLRTDKGSEVPYDVEAEKYVIVQTVNALPVQNRMQYYEAVKQTLAK